MSVLATNGQVGNGLPDRIERVHFSNLSSLDLNNLEKSIVVPSSVEKIT